MKRIFVSTPEWTAHDYAAAKWLQSLDNLGSVDGDNAVLIVPDWEHPAQSLILQEPGKPTKTFTEAMDAIVQAFKQAATTLSKAFEPVTKILEGINYGQTNQGIRIGRIGSRPDDGLNTKKHIDYGPGLDWRSIDRGQHVGRQSANRRGYPGHGRRSSRATPEV